MCLIQSPHAGRHAGSTRSAPGEDRVNRGRWPNTSTRPEVECFMQIPMCCHTGSTGSAPGTVRVNRGRWPNTSTRMELMCSMQSPHAGTPDQPGVHLVRTVSLEMGTTIMNHFRCSSCLAACFASSFAPFWPSARIVACPHSPSEPETGSASGAAPCKHTMR